MVKILREVGDRMLYLIHSGSNGLTNIIVGDPVTPQFDDSVLEIGESPMFKNPKKNPWIVQEFTGYPYPHHPIICDYIIRSIKYSIPMYFICLIP